MRWWCEVREELVAGVVGREGKREALFRRGCNYFIAPLRGLLPQVYSPILFQVHLAADYCGIQYMELT
jgi:hypothetical protein